jgi:hypothetical protein
VLAIELLVESLPINVRWEGDFGIVSRSLELGEAKRDDRMSILCSDSVLRERWIKVFWGVLHDLQVFASHGENVPTSLGMLPTGDASG